MLELINVTKRYKTGDLVQHALDGVSLAFRDNEFVSILGPSGSGKTTLLNVVGGLDTCDGGDLKINFKSTKKYTDADWDTYRNHSVGFVFQSYNLIPHQSVLSNVELALTIGGVSRAERRRRAKAALAEVGLAGQEQKRPNQMSGGQMQRVAIARALVNDPEILLADEPTGALDTETGGQIMELLAKVAEKRLVIMVTHNPELAERYSTRIVRLQDGRVKDDSAPFTPDIKDKKPVEKTGRARMRFLTALSLSAQNLRTKKGRTLLTAFAGSIGIIGIALILALSYGVNGYIDYIQKNTMSAYPITITKQTVDLTDVVENRSGGFADRLTGRRSREEETAPPSEVTANFGSMKMRETFSSRLAENDLTAFKRYLDGENNAVAPHVGENGIVYTYDVSFTVYTRGADGKPLDTNADAEDDLERGDSEYDFSALTRSGSGGGNNMFNMLSGRVSTGANRFSELLPGAGEALVAPVIYDSYTLAAGAWPENETEILLVTDKDGALSAEALYALGLMPLSAYADAKAEIEAGQDPAFTLDFETALGRTYYLIPACDRYVPAENGTFTAVDETPGALETLLDNAIALTVSGVIRPNGNSRTLPLRTPAVYTAALTRRVMAHTDESPVVQAQKASPEVNVLTGARFEALSDAEKLADVTAYIDAMGDAQRASLYSVMAYYLAGTDLGRLLSGPGEAGTQPANPEGESGTDPEAPAETPSGEVPSTEPPAQDPENPFAGIAFPTDGENPFAGIDLSGGMDSETLLNALLQDGSAVKLLLSFYDSFVAGATYDGNLETFGCVSPDSPASISIYTDSFENKDAVSAGIAAYNDKADEGQRITYTDYVSLITSSVTSIVDVISYVLIAFVSVSLIVSAIMIGIITHISVLERTKEIGILRALGASKGNISAVFNAETVLLGFFAGLLGVGLSALMTFPINAGLRALLDVEGLSVRLPLAPGAALVVLSIVVTLLGGLIPARKAAKKDPVVALRTE